MQPSRNSATRGLWFALALLVIVEAWLWDHVKEWLRALAIALAADRIEAFLVRLIARLSPLATLTLFIAPFLIILPLKLYALELLAAGRLGPALTVIFIAKSLGLGVTAFLFDHCREKLLQMMWFARFYAFVLRIRAWAHALIEPMRARLRLLRETIRARLAAAFDAPQSRFRRKVDLIRAMVRRAAKT